MKIVKAQALLYIYDKKDVYEFADVSKYFDL